MSPLAVAIPSDWPWSIRRLAAELVHSRSARVGALAAGIVMMSLGDLYLTLTFLHGPGLNEGNPLARWIIGLNNPWLLGMWKVMLLTLTTTILWVTRRTRSGEMAAWIGVAVMVWLTGQWMQYAEKVPALTHSIGTLADMHGTDFVRFSPTPQ